MACVTIGSDAFCKFGQSPSTDIIFLVLISSFLVSLIGWLASASLRTLKDETKAKLIIAFYGAFFSGFGMMAIGFGSQPSGIYQYGISFLGTILSFGAFAYFGIVLAIDKTLRLKFYQRTEN